MGINREIGGLKRMCVAASAKLFGKYPLHPAITFSVTVFYRATGQVDWARYCHFHSVRIFSLPNVALLTKYMSIVTSKRKEEIISTFVVLSSVTSPISPRT